MTHEGGVRDGVGRPSPEQPDFLALCAAGLERNTPGAAVWDGILHPARRAARYGSCRYVPWPVPAGDRNRPCADPPDEAAR